jgi:hypothetical protein
MTFAGDMQEYILRQILRFRGVAENSSGDSVHETEVTPEKDGKGIPFSP